MSGDVAPNVRLLASETVSTSMPDRDFWDASLAVRSKCSTMDAVRRPLVGEWNAANAISLASRIRKESVPKIIINNTINYFLTAIRILLVSNHSNFRVLFDKKNDKIVSVYFISKIYLYFSIGNGQPGKPALCQLYRHTFVPCVSTISSHPSFSSWKRLWSYWLENKKHGRITVQARELEFSSTV